MKWVLFWVLLIIFSEGCSASKNTFEFNLHEPIRFISSDLNSESFLAILNSGNIVKIDSNGSSHTLGIFDPSIRTFELDFLNDSVLLYRNNNNYSFYIYNINSRNQKKIDIFEEGQPSILTLSNNRKFIAASYHYDLKRWVRIYKLDPDKETYSLLSESSEYNSILDAVGNQRFVLRRSKGDDLVVNPDMTVVDTMYHSYSSYFDRRNNNKRFRGDNFILHGAGFDQINSDYYIKAGFMTKEEEAKAHSDNYHEVVGEERNSSGSDGLIAPVWGYWILMNFETKKQKKIGFRDFAEIISASDRHILFYKFGEESPITIVSVPNLIKGM